MNAVWHISQFDLTLRILAAAAMGGLIGFEREWSNHAAGLRTHILVCIGSTAIMLLSIYGFNQFVDEMNVRIDPARLAAQVITGIGFLGAGAIMRNGSTVSGLTTAASIWVVAAIGLCVGAGFFYCAVLSTVMVLLSLFVLNKWEKRLLHHRRHQEILIRILDRPGLLGEISILFGEQGIQIVNVKFQPEGSGLAPEFERIMELRFSVKTTNVEKLMCAMEKISNTNDVVSLESNYMNLYPKVSVPRPESA